MQGMIATQGVQDAVAPLAPARMTTAAAVPGFRVAPQAAAGAARAAAGAAPTSAMVGLLAVQEAEADAARDRAARKRGRAMLDALARLQRMMLAGRFDESELHDLAALAADPAEAADPALGTTLREVAARARVELARLAMRQGSDSGKRTMSAA